MQTWNVRIGHRVSDPIDADFVLEACETMEGTSAVATLAEDGHTGSFRLFVDGRTAADAVQAAVRLVAGAVPGAYITAIEVKTEEEFEEELERPIFPEVVGYAEVAEMAGVSRQRARELAKNADFPPAVIVTKQGPLMARSAVQGWVSRRRTTPGRRPKVNA